MKNYRKNAFIKFSILLKLLLISYLGNSQTTYNSQYIVNMPNDEVGETYNFQHTNKIQQSFRLNMDDVNATTATIKHLLLNINYTPGPNYSQININFYEGTIDNLGTQIHTQPYTWEFIDGRIHFSYASGGNAKIFTIEGELKLDVGTDYVLEIEVPENYDGSYRSFGFNTTESDLGTCNRGDRDIWMKLYGSVTSNANASITLENADDSNYYLDTFSEFFPAKLLNKFEPENLFVNTSLAGNLEYRSSNESIVKVEIKEQENGIKDEIELMGLEEGKEIIYIVHENDTISQFYVTSTTKRIIPVTYQYIKYPGEVDHMFQNIFEPITKIIGDIYDLSNVSINFTNQGIIEYEWDLNGDGKSYDPNYTEWYSAADQIPNSNTYFSNIFMVRANKTDNYVGGANGGGSSVGYGGKANPPRYAFCTLHLYKTIENLASTLAHELGHNFGLGHMSSVNKLGIDVPNDIYNIMRLGRTKNLIYASQWNTIHNTIKYRETKGEMYDTRLTPQIDNFEDTNIELGDSNFQLTATTNSDSEIIYKLISGDNITVDNAGNIQIIKDGVAEIMAYTYATKNYIATSKKITVTVSNTLSIGDIEDNLIKIYPNPSEGVININLKTLENVNIHIFDATGKVVYKKENLNTKTQKIILKESSGIYILKVSTKNQFKTYKLIIK